MARSIPSATSAYLVLSSHLTTHPTHVHSWHLLRITPCISGFLWPLTPVYTVGYPCPVFLLLSTHPSLATRDAVHQRSPLFLLFTVSLFGHNVLPAKARRQSRLALCSLAACGGAFTSCTYVVRFPALPGTRKISRGLVTSRYFLIAAAGKCIVSGPMVDSLPVWRVSSASSQLHA